MIYQPDKHLRENNEDDEMKMWQSYDLFWFE